MVRKDAAGESIDDMVSSHDFLLPSGFSIVWQIVLSFRQRSLKATAHGWNSLRILFLSILGISSEVRYLYPAFTMPATNIIKKFSNNNTILFVR